MIKRVKALYFSFLQKREADFIESQEDNLCEYCEENILGCKSMTIHFMCEGCKCDEAKEDFIEDYKDTHTKWECLKDIYFKAYWIINLKAKIVTYKNKKKVKKC